MGKSAEIIRLGLVKPKVKVNRAGMRQACSVMVSGGEYVDGENICILREDGHGFIRGDFKKTKLPRRV